MSFETRCRSIFAAARSGDVEFIKLYIQQHKEYDTLSTHHDTTKPSTKRSVPVVKCTSSVLGDVSLEVRESESGYTPLMLAVIFQQRECVQLLLQAGASPNTLDVESGWNSLAHALYRGDFLTAHLLLSHSRTPLTAVDSTHSTALDLALHHIVTCSSRDRSQNGNGRVGQSTSSRGGTVRTSTMMGTRQTGFQALASDATKVEERPTHNLLYSFGYQSQYTLGYSCDHYQHRPRLIDQLASLSIKQVCALKQAVFVLDINGHVYSFGQGAAGKLGHETRDTLIEPKRIAALHSITHIGGTDEMMIAVNAKGHAYGWGYSPFFESTTASSSSNASSGTSSSASNAASLSRFQTSSPVLRSDGDPASNLTTVRFWQLPRRIDCLRSINVHQVYPSASRVLVLTTSGELYFIGQSIEDIDRWESNPKKFAAAIADEIVQVCNREEFVAVLTTTGSIRIQRRGERKLNKIWLQNYPESTIVDTSNDDQENAPRRKCMQTLFPQIPPNAHVIKMAWSHSGQRGAAVTRAGEVFVWKLPLPEPKLQGASNSPTLKSTAVTSATSMPTLTLFPSAVSSTTGSSASTGTSDKSNRTSYSYPRVIGYFVEGLAHVRATDVAVASGHTSALTEDGHVYHWGPSSLGLIHPSDSTSTTASSATGTGEVSAVVSAPRRLMHLSQVSQMYSSDQYLITRVSIHQPTVLPSFPELRGLYDPPARKSNSVPIEVPSLRLLCQYQLASEQVNPISVLSAYQWSYQTSNSHLLDYCCRYLLENLPYYLHSLLTSAADISFLQYLQQQYLIRYPMWFYCPQWTQPLQDLSATVEDDLEFSEPISSPLQLSKQQSRSSATLEPEPESFSFSHALAQMKQAQLKASKPKTIEERVSEIKVKRRGISKKLQQIEHLEQKKLQRLDADQREKLASKEKLQMQLQDLDGELLTLRDGGSVSAAKLWDTIHGVNDPDATDIDTAASAAAAEAEKEKQEQQAVAEAEVKKKADAEARTRVAADLVDRPVRALQRDIKPEPAENRAKKQQQPAKQDPKVSSSPAQATPIATVAIPAPKPVAAASWNTTVSPQVKAATPLASNSLAAIQAEEARALEAAKAAEAAKRTAMKPTTTKSMAPPVAGGIVPSGVGKVWGQSVASTSAVGKNDFPSLGAKLPAASPSPQHGPVKSHHNVVGSPLARPASASSFSPSFSPAPSSAALSCSNAAPTAFSLADFMPALPKAKPTPTKVAWSAAAPTVAPASAPVIAASQSQGSTSTNNPKKQKGQKQAQQSAASGPVSFLSIQAAEQEQVYGKAASFLTKRELEELESSRAGGEKSAWNINAAAHAISAPSMQELQVQQEAEEKKKKERAEKAQKKKEQRSQAKEAVEVGGAGNTPSTARPNAPNKSAVKQPSEDGKKEKGQSQQQQPQQAKQPKQSKQPNQQNQQKKNNKAQTEANGENRTQPHSDNKQASHGKGKAKNKGQPQGKPQDVAVAPAAAPVAHLSASAVPFVPNFAAQ